MDLVWNSDSFLRQSTGFRCRLCPVSAKGLRSPETVASHVVVEAHPQHLEGRSAEERQMEIDALIERSRPQPLPAERPAVDGKGGAEPPSPEGPQLPADADRVSSSDLADDGAQPRTGVKSPIPSAQMQEGSPEPLSASQSMSRPQRLPDGGPSSDFPSWPPPDLMRRLWGAGDAGPTRGSAPLASAFPPRQPGPRAGRWRQQVQSTILSAPSLSPHSTITSFVPEDELPEAVVVRKLEIKPISQDQLVAEVKEIYKKLVMVESECIAINNTQNALNETGIWLNDDQWQDIFALYRTLLDMHHDFFLTSQHPSASPALRRLASKYSMPARMWRYGIHHFLELMRNHLPHSLEHMVAFIHLAYSIMVLLYEAVPVFEDAWIECLGDLSRYRMAIEEEEIGDKEMWASVSRNWYTLASDHAPTTGHLYHHLAILARPNATTQLFYFVKSLMVPIPFTSTRDSIQILFPPILAGSYIRLPCVDAVYIKAHGLLFEYAENSKPQFATAITEFLNHLGNNVAYLTEAWIEPGYHIAIINSSALLGYGSEDNVIMDLLRKARADEAADETMLDDGEEQAAAAAPAAAPAEEDIAIPEAMAHAQTLAVKTDEVILARFGDTNCLSYIYVRCFFMLSMAQLSGAVPYLEKAFPWKLFVLSLNYLLDGYTTYDKIESESFPGPAKEEARPLPEEWALHGLLWAKQMFPNTWFRSHKFDDEEQSTSMVGDRKERILWMGCRLASYHRWLSYDAEAHQFAVVPEDNVAIDAGLEEGIPSELDMTMGDSDSDVTITDWIFVERS